MPYQWDAKPNTVVTDSGQQALNRVRDSEYAVLVGRNNCGKSFILKTLTQQIGQGASYLGPARHQNFNVLGYYTPNRNKKQEKWRRFIQEWQNQQQNIDNSPLNLQQAIAELSDQRRASLSEIIKMLLGTELELLYTVTDNSMSQKYISCHGHNISYTSSGFRLITSLLTSLLDDDYDTFLIDEPELGISPEAQGLLADFLYDREHRRNYFPHVKTLIIATHSTIFLDRRHISNNYTVAKTGDAIDIRQATTITDFNNIHFFLLGNRLETLYLPACIVLTEGKCDRAYISRVLETRYSGVQFSVINAGSDSRMKEIVSLAGSLLTDLQKSPYRTRILPVLDSTHGQDIVEMFKKAGIPEENIIIWDKNGIEYYYPDTVLALIFGAGGEITIQDDVVSRNGVAYKKWELCEKVTSKITDGNLEYPTELSTKLFGAVDRVCNITA
ncbi:MAG: AAA family ATPase [Pirellulaceae bacterium]|nr:AAA family ATPase [Pirellulaceae bacterium]